MSNHPTRSSVDILCGGIPTKCAAMCSGSFYRRLHEAIARDGLEWSQAVVCCCEPLAKRFDKSSPTHTATHLMGWPTRIVE